MMSTHYDVIVIGSGFGGALAAYRLAQTGLNTILLEKGGWPRRDKLDTDARAILVQQRYRAASPLMMRQYGARHFTPMNTNGIPRICSHLLAEHPNLKIIVLLAEGKTAFLYESGSSKKYINEPSADTIVNTIRQSLEKIRNKQSII